MEFKQPLSLYLLFCSISGLIWLLLARSSKSKYSHLPWINYNDREWFATLRTKWRNSSNILDTLQFAYQKYSKSSKAYVLTELGCTTIILPRSCAEWMIAQPDSHLLPSAIEEVLQPDHGLLVPEVIHNPLHHHTIATTLTRNTPNLIPEIYDEVAAVSDEDWGTDSNWHDVCIYDAVQHIIARASNRIFVGLPLCRNETMLTTATKWSVALPMSGMLLRSCPTLLKIFLGPLITIPNHWYARKYVKILTPEIQRRKQTFSPESKDKPNDFLQWTIDAAERSDLKSEREPQIIALRILATIFGTIHTSTFITTNAILDLAHCDPSDVKELRQEIQEGLAANNGNWDKHLVRRLVKLDSSMREAARLRSFALTNVNRKVMVPEGLDAPDGTHLPYGVVVALPTLGIHTDEDIYEDALTFKPFRHVEKEVLAEVDSLGNGDLGSKKGAKKPASGANRSLVSLSPTYQPFGLGKHACPGRFFASTELRLLVAYLILNYDIEHQTERPGPKAVLSTVLPPTQAKIRIRRVAH